MTVGAVISSRHFCHFIGSGKVYQTEKAGIHQRGEHQGVYGTRNAWGNIFNKMSPTLRECSSYMSRNLYSSVHLIGPLDKKTGKLKTGILGEVEHLHLYPPFTEIFCVSNLKQRIQGRCGCSISSDPSVGSSIHPRNLHKFGISNAHFQQSDCRKATKTRADYKSEQYDIAGAKLDSLSSLEVPDEAVLVEGRVRNISWWEQLPKRWVIVLLCCSAFLLCNMDRVNMSIAILPMSQEFKWNSATIGLIQSSFFWGYLLTQIVGGIWADKIGGKIVLGFGVVWWSVATVLTPIAARLGLPFLLLMRAFMGIGEGVAMPAMNNILSKWVPVSERSRSLAFVYSGMYLGSVTGLAFSPILIHKFGWPSVFYTFGSLGSIWFALWLNKAHSSPKDDPDLSDDEKRLILGGSDLKEPVSAIPWKLILSKAPVWALIISHFCHNWGTFILLTWMPTYYNQVLKFNLTESGLFCVLPWLTMAVFANIGGWIADTLVSKGLSITTVRKIMQSIGFLGPAFFLTQLSHVHTPALSVLCMACSQVSCG